MKTHPEEIQNEIALLTKEIARTRNKVRQEAIRDRLAELANELAGYQPIKRAEILKP